MVLLPLALPVLAHHAAVPEPMLASMDHGEHDVPRQELPCPPLETGLEACCVVDGLPPASPSTLVAPRVAPLVTSLVSPRTCAPSPPRDARYAPHPWPRVPARIALSTFLN